MPGEWPSQAFSGRWNGPNPDEPKPRITDCGWIGEDARGVWIARDPNVAVLEHPGLWPVLDEWDAGLRDLTREDLDSKSSYHYTAKLHLAVAQAREDRRGRQTD